MISIKVPPLGESIVEATVARWVKREGDTVAQGDTIVELETDKITVEVPAIKAGTLVKRLHQEGDVVKVDDELGQIDETATAAAPRATAAVAAAGASTSAPTATQAPAPPLAPSPTRASPAARRVADDSGIDLASVPGSGRGGMVTKSDVIEAHGDGATAQRSAAPTAPAPPAAPSPTPAPRPTPAPAVQGRETRERMTTRRKRIAENLVQAQHATAHLTTFNEVDMSAVMGVRERLKERIEKQHGVKLT
ncbi:MAG TPA: biotin/lipoyl-containing protein, partial [Gemmatimonadaceae bacterium]|nr:biotin/lipoyl-containing protein [Gemmatimonadaceae bacterium]